MRELRQNWLDIFSAFRIAIDPKKMMLGFVGGLVSLAVVFGLLYLFRSVFPNGLMVLSGFVLDPIYSISTINQQAVTTLAPGVVIAREGGLIPMAMRHLAPGMIGAKEVGFMLVAGVLMLLIWSYFGGTILRSSAVEFSKDDRIDLREASGFARKKYSSFFWAPVVPCLGIVFLLLCIYLGGLVGRIPYVGPVVDGLFFFLALLAGFLIILIALGTLFGAPLMGPTIATEGTDAFDAISRSFAYVFGRPWRYIWYYLVGAAYAVVCTAFVAAFAYGLIAVALGAGRAGMGESFRPIDAFLTTNQRDPNASIVQNFCAVLMRAGIIVTWGLVIGFAISMKATLCTIIYCLLRKDVDGTDMTEVFIEEEEEEGLIPQEGKPSEGESAGPPSAEPQAPSAGEGTGI